MGYESHIDIIATTQSSIDYAFDNNRTAYAERVASLNLSKMDYDNGFHELFKRPISEFRLEFYHDDGNTPINGDSEDNYGDKYKFAEVKQVLEWCKKDIAESKAKGEEPYRRTILLRDTLKNFASKKAWGDHEIFVVHSGY